MVPVEAEFLHQDAQRAKGVELVVVFAGAQVFLAAARVPPGATLQLSAQQFLSGRQLPQLLEWLYVLVQKVAAGKAGNGRVWCGEQRGQGIVGQ